MVTVQGREFILHNGFLEQIVKGAKAPNGYIGVYGLQLPPYIHYIFGLDGNVKPIDIKFADCVYVPFENKHF